MRNNGKGNFITCGVSRLKKISLENYVNNRLITCLCISCPFFYSCFSAYDLSVTSFIIPSAKREQQYLIRLLYN